MPSKNIGLAGALIASSTVLAMPSTGAGRGTEVSAAAVPIILSVNTAELNPNTFRSPWQVAWIPSGTKTGAIAFTDRGGNQVGILDPTSLRTVRIQNVRLNNITSPGPIVLINDTSFAAAGTGGVAIFDRSGSGKVTELVMLNTRNQALAVGPGNNLFVADAQQHDLRIIRPPYGGPADITRFPIPQQCRNPTGLIPGTTTIDVLCQQTNNIVRIGYTGNFGGSIPLPVANAGAQEARPSPTGFVFSGFNANRFFSFSESNRQFKSFALTGPAVPTVGLFFDPASDRKLTEAAARLRNGKKPARAFFFNSFTPSFRDGTFSFGSFPAGTSSAFTRLAGRNLVGSTNGPGGSIWVADATPGRPALHRIDLGDGTKTGRTKTGYRFSQWFTKPGPDFLARMSMPFTGPVPTDVRVSVTGASASPWNLEPTFTENFSLKAIVRGALPGAGSYQVKVRSADTGPYTRAYRFSGIRPETQSLTLTLSGGGELPASFKVDAVTDTPCECKKLTARIGDVVTQGRIFPIPKVVANEDGFEMEFFVNMVLSCSKGTGDSLCTGELELSPTAADRANGLRLEERFMRATCKGLCRLGGGTASKRILLEGGPRFGSKNLGKSVRSISLEIDRICAGKRSSQVVEFAFGANGKLDLERSDLNGNGVADGKEKK